MGKKIITVDLNFPNESHTIVNEPVDEYTAIKEEAAIGPPPELTLQEEPKKRKPAPKKAIIKPVEKNNMPVVAHDLNTQNQNKSTKKKR